MKAIRLSGFALFTILAIPLLLKAQQPSATAAAVVPRLVSFSGRGLDAQGRPVSGIAGLTFTIYKEQYDGAPLWMETQNVQTDSKGNYSIQLGATRSDGLPVELFASGEARWLGVRVNGGEEQPRVMLLSVPYALKAGDAATIGGLPPSAFALAAPISARPASASGLVTAETAATPANPAVTGVGTTGTIPLWNSASDLTSSAIVQTGSGSTARIGINTSPSTTLDVKGTSNFRGSATMPSAGLATASAGKNSYPFVFATSSYNSGAKTSVLENFRWQAEPVGNNSTNPSGKLNLLFSSGSATPVETGLSIAGNGRITFAAGQTFPGGSGTVTSVGLSAPSSDFSVSGSPVTSSGNLSLAWKVAPTSADTANAIVKRDSSGAFSAGPITASQLTTGTIFASGMGLGTTAPTERLDLGNDGNVVINAFPGDDTTQDNVAYSLVGRGTGGVPQKWSIFTAAVGGGFGVPANSLSVWEYPANTANGCCLQRFTILPAIVPSVPPVIIDGYGHVNADYVQTTYDVIVGGELRTSQSVRVGQDVLVDLDAQVLGCIYASGTVIAGTCRSDVRFKKNIRPYPAVLNKLVQLQPVSYDWRANEFPQYHFGTSRASGLIAQEVEKVFPDMVSVDKNGFKRVNYSQLPYLMLEAIRELKAENDRLRANVEAEDQRIRQMAAQAADRSDERLELARLRAEVQRLAKLLPSDDGTGIQASLSAPQK